MKAKFLSLFTLALFTCFFIACDSPDASQSAEGEEETAEEAVEEQEETEAVASPKTAMIIQHEVEDYKTWKAKFDEHASARKEAKMSDWALLTGRDNPNMVTVIESVGDMEAAKAFTQSEDLKSAMEGAGVKGKPEISFKTVEVMDQEAGKSSDVRLYVQHKVEDYAAWKKVFDSKKEMHKEAGISPVAIARDMEDPNDLTVVLTAADFETLENFTKNEELKAAMKKAGVIGKPEFNYMNIQALAF